LIKQIEKNKKTRRILLAGLGLTVNAYAYLLACQNRGGEIQTRPNLSDLVDSDYVRSACRIEEGVSFLDSKRLRNIVADLYRHKRKGRIIYITATALCQVVNQYGQSFLALPVAMGDFGLTNFYQIARHIFSTMLLGGVGPLYMMGNPVSLVLAFILGAFGLRLAYNNLEFIATTPIDLTKKIEPQIPGISYAVVINNSDKVKMSNPAEEHECWLPEQKFFNPKCKLKLIQIP
jgi:hypothetical protein